VRLLPKVGGLSLPYAFGGTCAGEAFGGGAQVNSFADGRPDAGRDCLFRALPDALTGSNHPSSLRGRFQEKLIQMETGARTTQALISRLAAQAPSSGPGQPEAEPTEPKRRPMDRNLPQLAKHPQPVGIRRPLPPMLAANYVSLKAGTHPDRLAALPAGGLFFGVLFSRTPLLLSAC